LIEYGANYKTEDYLMDFKNSSANLIALFENGENLREEFLMRLDVASQNNKSRLFNYCSINMVYFSVDFLLSLKRDNQIIY